MKLIVGLGNIGKSYEKTRHNYGFIVVDRLARELGAPAFSKSTKLLAEVSEVLIDDEKIILAKPTTMMNLSGQAVAKLMHYYKVNLEDIWVIHDELDLDFGLLRLRQGGGSAGNNGISSIIEAVGTVFWRFRLGIANEHLPNTDGSRFVLDEFSKAEAAQLDKLIAAAASQIEKCLKNAKLLTHSDLNLIQ